MLMPPTTCRGHFPVHKPFPSIIKSIHDIVYLTKPTWPSRLPVESEKQAQIPVESFLWLPADLLH